GLRVSLEYPAGHDPQDIDVLALARTLAVSVLVPAGGEWHGTVRVYPIADHETVRPVDHHAGSLAGTGHDRRLRARARGLPPESAAEPGRLPVGDPNAVLSLPPGVLDAVLDRSLHDLGSLRIPMTDATGARADAVAAGAPWFMTLFGRDSLLTCLMALPVE